MREKLRALRLESGLTQKELAAKLNSTDKSIWNYENGIATPPYEVLIAYTKFFDVSADYLLGLEDDFGARTATGGNVMRDTNNTQERELLELFRTLSPYLQGLTMEAVRSWAKKGGDSSQKKA